MMWTWLRRRLGGRGGVRRWPLVADKLGRRVQALLEAQRADAEAKAKEAWYWGDSAGAIRRAVRDCEAILLPPPEVDAVDDYFRRVLPALRTLAEAYRQDPADEDGYGLGTVREIQEDVIAMARVCQSPWVD